MAVIGIICEYNPFHNGHLWQLRQARRLCAGPDAENNTGVVCIMSPDVVQRGEFAVMEKYARAESAVLCGADLVLELPSAYACASAEYFARGAVGLLHACGIATHLSFGMESGLLAPLERAVECMEAPDYHAAFKSFLDEGLSYPAARQKAAARTGREAEVFSSPNNILAIEYLRALKELAPHITPLPVVRTGGRHDAAPEGGISSASYIRAHWDKAPLYLPDNVYQIVRREMEAGRAPVVKENYESQMLAVLRRMRPEDFLLLPDCTEGLHIRLASAVEKATCLDEITALAKSKRYTAARIRRILLCAYLGLTKSYRTLPPSYLRVLAFNDKGRALLRGIKKISVLPVITKPAHAMALTGRAGAQFALEVRVGQLYSLAYPGRRNRAGGKEWRATPVYVKNPAQEKYD